MPYQKRLATEGPGGDRATRGLGMTRNHACQPWWSRSTPQILDRECRPSETPTSVRFGGSGGSATSHEAITSAKAKSSNSGSANTTSRKSNLASRKSNLAATSALTVNITSHTETGCRSSAVAEITCESPAGDTACCSSVETVILRGLARSATGIVSRSTPPL